MWYYLDDGKPSAPLNDVAFNDLVARGVITPNTYVWKQGDPEWVLLSARRTVRLPVPAPARVAQSQGTETATAWQRGRYVITQDELALPARCFKCNEEVTDPPLLRRLTWHTPWLYLLAFAGLIIYVIVAIFVRDRATVDIYLCARHRKLRTFFILFGWLGFLLALGLLVLGVGRNSDWIAFTGIALVFIAPIAGISGSSICQTRRINGTIVWLTGAGRAFRESLPRWP